MAPGAFKSTSYKQNQRKTKQATDVKKPPEGGF
jgi:hypothetical protein